VLDALEWTRRLRGKMAEALAETIVITPARLGAIFDWNL